MSGEHSDTGPDRDGAGETAYRVVVDRDACDGVFACLVRDGRFVEADDGLAGFDCGAASSVERSDESIAATFEDGRLEAAESAAAACPLDAITVTERSTERSPQ